MSKRNRILLVLLVSLLLALGYYYFAPKSSSVAIGKFSPTKISLALYDLLDLGVADINSDGYLDVFTTNHSARQSIILGDGKGQFENSLDTLKLGQDHNIPGIEDSDKSPEFNQSGYYIYRETRRLYIVAHKIEALPQLKGSMTVPWPMVIEDKKNAEVKLTMQDEAGLESSSTIAFDVKQKGLVQMNGADDISELPHTFSLDKSVDLTKVFLGSSLVNPTSHTFTISWRDRHSMSWADINDDGMLDVYIGRGGVKGKLDQLKAPIYDELYINQGDYFEDENTAYKMEKNGCPGRQSAWVDYDRNGQLDLYVSCGRSGSDQFPNLLYARRKADFVEVGPQLKLDFGREAGFVWVDSDNDSDMDLIVLSSSKLIHYRNVEGSFSPKVIIDSIPLMGFVKFSISDFDQDGDFDVFLVSWQSSVLLTNLDGAYSVVDPSDLGLPMKAYSAEWVDVDNDGLVDLHAIPGGIYMQTDNRQFIATNELDPSVDFARVNGSRCSWFDFNNDGARDVLCAVQSYPNKPVRAFYKIVLKTGKYHYWKSYFFENTEKDNHWLQLNLTGSVGNRQAIGARVDVTTLSGKQSQFVGQNEGSIYSQGHYRLYFGLGADDLVETISVTWPDGTIKNLSDIPSDQILSIDY
ncbi:MAG: CRTAC1 family protein [Acidiferrobacterales bacterium]|nr:CRTAC1 family protein [Acidiferrobacterales bacterium]